MRITRNFDLLAFLFDSFRVLLPLNSTGQDISHLTSVALSAYAFAADARIGDRPIVRAGYRNIFPRGPGSSQTGRFSSARPKNSRRFSPWTRACSRPRSTWASLTRASSTMTRQSRYLAHALQRTAKPAWPQCHCRDGLPQTWLCRKKPLLTSSMRWNSILQALMRMRPWLCIT